jgi:phage N-6-adenine-methyltransferase
LRTGPTINRESSRQDYETPNDFIEAVQDRFGPIEFDLAASESNRKSNRWFSETDNALIQNWSELDGLLWLNPPFKNIEPWASKCALEAERGARILFLTPASVGANWFSQHIHRKALVLGLNGRLQFVGATQPYPKDCILSCFGFGVGFDTWRWK